MEYCIGLVAFFFLAATVIVAVVFILTRSSSSNTPAPRDLARRRRKTCPACVCHLDPSDRDCPDCGLDQDSRLARQIERVRHAELEVTALAERGELETPTANDVAARLRERIRTLMEPAPKPTPLQARAKRAPVIAQRAPASAVPVPVAQPRLEEFLEIAEERPIPGEPPRPRGGMLSAFMEDKNILWGELVGGLLIVGCSIALVLTLWRSLEALPYFPFLLSTAITAILFGAGQYTLHHWKLASTSRGLLVIALLLAPLNLLLLATPGTETAIGWLDISVKVVAVVIFVGIVRASGRDLIGTDLLPGPVNRRWLLALAVVGAPASQSIAVGEWTFLPLWLPLMCQALASAAVLGGLTWYRPKGESASVEAPRATALLMFIGIGVFALGAAWGLLLARSADLPITLNQLALPLVIASIPILEAGLLLHRRLVAGHAGLRATGTGVALAGSGLLVGGVILAWPDPLWLTLVASAVGLLFTRIAWRDGFPWFQIGALPALGLASVLGIHGAMGHWPIPDDASASGWLFHYLGSSTSGIVLAGLALILAAIAELAVRLGNRTQGIGYAFGAVAAGLVALFVANVHGPEEPWIAVGVQLVCAFGLIAANFRWKVRIAAEAGVWLILLSTLWVLWAMPGNVQSTWSFGIALESFAFALAALGLSRAIGAAGSQLRGACRDVSVAGGLLSVAFVFATPGFPRDPLHSGTLLVLAFTSMVLARAFAQPWLTWVGSFVGLLAGIHFTIYTAEVRPYTAALLLAILAHATFTAMMALALRRRPSLIQLFADPLRQSARIASCCAVPLLFFPESTHALSWAGFTLWLAVIWFGMVWKWRDTGAFAAGQGAISLAAALAGLAWAEGQEWWLGRLPGLSDPRTFQAFGVALGALALVWIALRRALKSNGRLRELWLSDPLSVDRIVTGCAVIGQLMLLAVAVASPVRSELTPLSDPFKNFAPAEWVHAFGPGAWLVLGVLGFALVASLRLRTDDEPDGDPALIGLAILGLSLPLMVAGAFAPEVAAASALRWGLAIAFVLGSCVLCLREQLGLVAAKAGFALSSTSLATKFAYGLFAVAAGVAVILTVNTAALGLVGLKPSGPDDASIFSRIGWTASSLLPMALIVLGLTGTAIRERLSGYAFAAGLLFTATVAGGYALTVTLSGMPFDSTAVVRLGMITAGSAAIWSLGWHAVERRMPGGLLLDFQSSFGIFGIGLLAFGPLMQVLFQPGQPMLAAYGELGLFGWSVLVLAGWAAFQRASIEVRGHVLGFAGMVAGVFAACAVQPFDEPGKWLSFTAISAAWAIIGITLTGGQCRSRALGRGIWANVIAAGLAVMGVRYAASPIGDWLAPVLLASYALLTATVVRWIGGKNVEPGDSHRWTSLIASQLIVAVPATVLGVIASLTASLFERLAGPSAIMLLALTAILGYLKTPASWAERYRVGAMFLFGVALILSGWAYPEPESPAVWLLRNGWAFAALVLAVVLLALVRKGGGAFAIAALIALSVVLIQQVAAFDTATKHTPLELPEMLAVLAGIAALIAMAIRFALRPEADPFRLTDELRQGYVYLAEVLLVLFFVHLRLNVPEMFLGQTVRYWTFFVMLLAFVGVGFGELFERRGFRVFALPLRRTVLLLPLIPLIAFWAKPDFLAEISGKEMPAQRLDSYAWLWLLAGLLYGLIALRRRSFGWALVAALAANAGMWALLAHNGVSAAVHPQVWVIPLAFILLISEHIHRRALRPEIATGLRYLGIGMLYLSSAADMFIAEAGESIWLPVVLAVLCVAGIFAGILLRVRAFLFLGVGFLLLDIFAMIWHSAVNRDQTWVWYVSGIVLGIAILALFALFEKRKNDVHAVVEQLRRWD